MDDDLIIMVNFENICRLCMRSTGAMSEIFSTHGDNSMQQQILCITGLATEEGDGLPSKICHRCRHVIEQACELRDVVNKCSKILARTALGNDEKCYADNDFDNETFLDNVFKQHENHSDADTIIIENDENGTQDDTPEGTIIEEYDVSQEAVDITQDTEYDIYENDSTEIYEEFITEIPASGPSIRRQHTMPYAFSTTTRSGCWWGGLVSAAPLARLRKAELMASIASCARAPVPRRKYDGKKPPAHLICQLCLDQFADEEDVRTHVEEHYVGSDLEIYLDITKRPFRCTACDELQLNKPQLVKHHRLHLGVNPYVCKHPGCSYEGKTRDGLRHHRVIHEAPSRVCEQCGGAFRRRSDLVAHMTRAHPLAAQARLSSRVCASCGLSSRNEPALRRHMKAHHFAPRYPCPYGSCERAYRSRSALADHERAHRGERRFRCPLCNVADYTSTSSLKRHMKLHDRIRVSKCDKCPLTFEEYGTFYRHRIAHHGAWQPHRCRACNQGYQSESTLEKHEEGCERLKRLLAYEQEHVQTDTRDGMETDEPE